MEAAERQDQILLRARADGRVDVGKLAVDLGVAAETVRRDLRQLVDRGVLQRVHGGAYPVESAGFETNIAHRSSSLIAEKRRIGARRPSACTARRRSTSTRGSPRSSSRRRSRRRSGSPWSPRPCSRPTALAESPSVTVLLLGGRLRGRTMATVDHWATQMLGELVIDLAYLGANGISREHGLTTPDPAVAAVKSQVVARARRKVFVGLHTKFGVSSFCRFAQVADFEALVTDTGLSAGEAHRFAVLGPQVIRA